MQVQNTLRFYLSEEEKKTLKAAAAILEFDGIDHLYSNCGSEMVKKLRAAAQTLEQLADNKTFTMRGECIE